jgi:hypothetical protein
MEEKMFSKNRLFITVVSVILLICISAIGTGSVAIAKAPASTQQPDSQTVPYSGLLTNPGGQAVQDGNYDFTFSLYDTPESGNLLWTESQPGVPVTSGDFVVDLGQSVSLPDSVLSAKQVWIEVSVRGPGEGGFTLLSPRQMIFPQSPAQTDALTCPHSHFTDDWSGNVPTYGLIVDNNLGTGDGIRAYSGSTSNNYAAIWAVNVATTGYGTAVYAASSKGLGLYAYSSAGDAIEATTNSNTKSCVYAHSTNGNGVWAVSSNLLGVYGSSTNSYGVQGYNNHDPSSTGNYGGYFSSNNYRGGYIGADDPASWFGALINGGLILQNGGCIGCLISYVGMNAGEDTILPGDLVAVTGVNTDAATGQPVIQVRLAKYASDTVIGVAVEGTSAPGSQTGFDKIQTEKIMPGEYLEIAVSGLVQARVADTTVAIGDYLMPGPAAAVVTTENSSSVVRMMSLPDDKGFAWVMVNSH